MVDNNYEHSGMFSTLEHIWKNSFGIIKDIFKLFSLEVKLAGRSLATISVLAVIGAVLLLSSWLSLLGAAITWLMSLNISLLLSLCLMSALNLIIAIAIIYYIIKIATNLQFRETRKQLDIMRDDDETITPKN